MDSCFEDGLIKEEYDEIEEVSMHLVLSNQEGEQAAKRRKAQVGAKSWPQGAQTMGILG